MRRQVSGAETAITELLTEVDAIKSALARSGAPAELRDQAEDIRHQLLQLQLELVGDPNRELHNEGGPVPVDRRVMVAYLGTAFSTYGPTPTHQRSLEIAQSEFAPISAALQAINQQALPTLRAALDEAGVPWTPGRH
jgi:hypothetical protein